MKYLKCFIFSWSIVWAACLIPLGSLSALKGASVFLVIWKTERESNLARLFFYAPIYVFGFWMLGCLIIASILYLIEKAKP